MFTVGGFDECVEQQEHKLEPKVHNNENQRYKN